MRAHENSQINQIFLDYELPDGWLSKNLREVVSNKKGKLPRQLDGNPWSGSVPHIDIDAFERGNVNRHSDRESAVIVQNGDLIVVWDGARCGLVGKAPFEGSLGSTLMTLKPLQINSSYLFFVLSSYFKIINSNPRGIGIPHVEPDIFWNLEIPLPPLAEQQRIVTRVEALLTHVNAARDRLSRVPLIMKRFRQGVLAAACTGRLTEGWREENPDVEFGSQLLERIAGRDPQSTIPDDDDPPISLPEIPDTWKWSRCFSLCNPKRDITYGVIKLGAPVKGGIPTLRSSDVRWLFIDNNDVKTIDPNIASQYSRTFLKGGEIVITVRGSLGGIAVVPQTMAGYNISREVAVLPLLNELDPNYFSYAIASIWSQNWLSEVTKGVTYTGINIRDLKRLPLPFPPLAEQHEIVRRVNSLFELADAIEREVAAANRRCERLTQAVLGKAFRGELVVSKNE
jgi:type I restriction enzyme S subunit